MKKYFKGMRYAFTVINHPIRGFYDIRFEGQGNPVSASLWLVFLILVTIAGRQYSGFIFNTNNIREFNVITEISNVLVPVLLWCASNWCFTVLMDGKGRFRDIYMATAYSTVPFAIMSLVRMLCSLFVTMESATFLAIFSGIGMVYTAILLVTGMMTIHQFTVSKTLAAILLTILGMVFIVFLILLFSTVIDKMVIYISGIFTELKLRM